VLLLDLTLVLLLLEVESLLLLGQASLLGFELFGLLIHLVLPLLDLLLAALDSELFLFEIGLEVLHLGELSFDLGLLLLEHLEPVALFLDLALLALVLGGVEAEFVLHLLDEGLLGSDGLLLHLLQNLVLLLLLHLL